jgi:hypothetical protein
MLKNFHMDDWLTGHMKALMAISPEDASAYFKYCQNVPHCGHSQGLENDNTEDEEIIAMAVGLVAVSLLF